MAYTTSCHLHRQPWRVRWWWQLCSFTKEPPAANLNRQRKHLQKQAAQQVQITKENSSSNMWPKQKPKRTEYIWIHITTKWPSGELVKQWNTNTLNLKNSLGHVDHGGCDPCFPWVQTETPEIKMLKKLQAQTQVLYRSTYRIFQSFKISSGKIWIGNWNMDVPTGLFLSVPS